MDESRQYLWNGSRCDSLGKRRCWLNTTSLCLSVITSTFIFILIDKTLLIDSLRNRYGKFNMPAQEISDDFDTKPA